MCVYAELGKRDTHPTRLDLCGKEPTFVPSSSIRYTIAPSLRILRGTWNAGKVRLSS